MKVVFYILGILGVLGFCLIVFFAYVGASSPETSIYLGKQIPKHYLEEIKSLDLLDDDDEIKYLYSDGLMDIKDGLYFVTADELVLYSQIWEESEIRVLFSNIRKMDFEHNESVWEDSYIYLETKDEMEVFFPVSSEQGRDKLFYEYLLKKMRE